MDTPGPRVLSTVLSPIAFLVGCGGATAASPPPGSSSAAGASTAPARVTGAPPPRETESVPESVVQVSFEPLVTGVRPSETFLLAAHFRIAPGYRISWKAAGDVGQPTTVAFRGPPGFEVGPVLFPAPMKYTAPDGYTGFGYEKETAVFVQVRAPGGLRGDAVHRFDMDASWVACKKQCATERTSAFVELSTAGGSVAAKDVEASLAPFRARLPRPLSDVRDAASEWAESGRGATLVVKLPGAVPKEFFSDATADPAPTKTAFADGEVRFDYDEAPRPGSRPLRGVIVASTGGGDEFFDFEAPLPDAETAGAPEGKNRAKGKK